MIAVLVGCGGTKRAPTPKPDVPGVERTVHSGAGEATRREVLDDGRRVVRWTLQWDSARLDVTADGAIGGSMEGVRGVLYEDEEPMSDFTATEADADPDTGVLKLSGVVRVVSRDPGAPRLECEALEWDGAKELIAAKGRVRVVTDGWTVGPEDELWTNARLTRVGTPDRFGVNR